MIFGYYECVAFGKRVYVQKRENFVGFEELEGGDISWYWLPCAELLGVSIETEGYLSRFCRIYRLRLRPFLRVALVKTDWELRGGEQRRWVWRDPGVEWSNRGVQWKKLGSRDVWENVGQFKDQTSSNAPGVEIYEFWGVLQLDVKLINQYVWRSIVTMKRTSKGGEWPDRKGWKY